MNLGFKSHALKWARRPYVTTRQRNEQREKEIVKAFKSGKSGAI